MKLKVRRLNESRSKVEISLPGKAGKTPKPFQN